MGKILNNTKYFLVDNGSLNPKAVLNLRKIATALTKRTGFFITPLGLMHSHKIPPEDLEGERAESVESLFSSSAVENFEKVVFIPLFFGPSRAIIDWLPSKLESWQSQASGRSHEILDCLYKNGDRRIAKALVERTRSLIKKSKFHRPFVALVDHGTPLRSVNQVREEIGDQMKDMLDQEINGLSTCCMERREGEEYDFNDPLLEVLLQNLPDKLNQVVIAQLFLSPGRHAGDGGDLEKICEAFSGSLERTDLLGFHPLILDILEERLFDCVPWSKVESE